MTWFLVIVFWAVGLVLALTTEAGWWIGAACGGRDGRGRDAWRLRAFGQKSGQK
jgi:hypothetical protein